MPFTWHVNNAFIQFLLPTPISLVIVRTAVNYLSFGRRRFTAAAEFNNTSRFLTQVVEFDIELIEKIKAPIPCTVAHYKSRRLA